jgi:molybdate transport system substrate-binding protein
MRLPKWNRAACESVVGGCLPARQVFRLQSIAMVCHRLRLFGRLLSLILLLLPGVPARAQRDLTVAAAADLSAPLAQIVSLFEKQTGSHVRVSLGASGNLFHQIQNGGPYDVFLSADMDYPRKLVEAGLADAGSLRPYAVGRLALWLPRDSALKPEQRGLEVLLDPSVQKIAIGNPEHAPYGRAAVAALHYYHLYDKVAARLVLGENVSQAAQFVESGNAQAGLVALAHALAPEMSQKGRYWLVPAESYPRLDQGEVVVSRSAQKALSGRFLAFLHSAPATAILQRYGFARPEGAS